MIQIQEATKKLTATKDSQISCFYSNTTGKIQIIRIINSTRLSWEKVIFPSQRLIFETTQDSRLEVYSSENGITSIPSQVIDCAKLRLQS